MSLTQAIKFYLGNLWSGKRGQKDQIEVRSLSDTETEDGQKNARGPFLKPSRYIYFQGSYLDAELDPSKGFISNSDREHTNQLHRLKTSVASCSQSYLLFQFDVNAETRKKIVKMYNILKSTEGIRTVTI